MLMKWTLVIVAVASSACASTGAVPRPFPGASRPASAPATADAAAPAETDAAAAASANPMQFDAYALVGTALSLRGAPYRNGGTDPHGFDCSGFTQYVFSRYGIVLPRAVREQFHEGRPVDVDQLEPGDLVFFSTTDPGASHVAIAIGSDQFVHAPSSSGVVRVERLRSSYWSQRYIGARRVN
jgi:cell wall-associated NlpC family hydrolase